jgi:hypothetical protein
MVGGLFFITMFLISVISILLFAPGGMQPYQRADNPEQVAQNQKELTVQMARFLENNPSMVTPETFDRVANGSAPGQPASSGMQPHSPNTALNAADQTASISIQFLSSNMTFPSRGAYREWVAEQVKQDPISFIRELNAVNDPDLYLETLKQVSEIATDPQTATAAKEACLNKAGEWIESKDVFHQHMTQRALQQYLDSEPDQEKAKKRVDEFLQKHQNPAGAQPINQ